MTRVRITLDNKLVQKSKDNPERTVVIIDNKPLEIITSELEYSVDKLSTDIIENTIKAIERIKRTKGIKTIQVLDY